MNIIEETYLPTKEAADRYRIGIDTLRKWKAMQNFPHDRIRRDGIFALWPISEIDNWLRQRPINPSAPTPKWLSVVGHPELGNVEARAKERRSIKSRKLRKYEGRIDEVIDEAIKTKPERDVRRAAFNAKMAERKRELEATKIELEN